MSLGEKGMGEIVAAVDDSKDAATVVRVAGWLAAGMKTDLALLEVVPLGRFSKRVHGADFKEKMDEETKKRLESAAVPVRKGGVSVSTESLESPNSVVQSIIDYASKNAAGLI